MNAKFSVFVMCVELVIHQLLYNLPECNFKLNGNVVEGDNYSSVYLYIYIFKRNGVKRYFY